MLHFCQDCIVDWYNESDIRGSVTVSRRVELQERFEVEDPVFPLFFGFSKHWAGDESNHDVAAERSVERSRVSNQLLVEPPKFGHTTLTLLLKHVAADHKQVLGFLL